MQLGVIVGMFIRMALSTPMPCTDNNKKAEHTHTHTLTITSILVVDASRPSQLWRIYDGGTLDCILTTLYILHVADLFRNSRSISLSGTVLLY